jgi:hypothetical protein
MHRLSVSVVAASLLLLPVGCGDDGPSKEDFIAEGDRICLDLRRDTDAVEEPAPTEPIQELSAYLDELTPMAERALEDFEALEAPDDDQDVKDRATEALQAEIDRVEEASAAAQRGDAAAAGEALRKSEEASDETDAELQRYGFQECGRDD